MPGQVGNSGGKKGRSGRKSKAEELGIADLWDKAWPLADRHDVVRALHEQAKSGNVPAATLLFAYCYGKPTEKHEHSNPDGSALLQPVADAMVKAYGS